VDHESKEGVRFLGVLFREVLNINLTAIGAIRSSTNSKPSLDVIKNDNIISFGYHK
jgi:hypothetical protein